MLEHLPFHNTDGKYVMNSFNSEMWRYMHKNKIRKTDFKKDTYSYNIMACHILEESILRKSIRIPGIKTKEDSKNFSSYGSTWFEKISILDHKNILD